ncbi:8-amino-7-oxononanoate synthase [Psychromonas sp. SR45-3]|uniref:8-amino-7-oxononanoate synthase n=1 Tax=Psychromonas sp. SR45-3 TaxID=2760930 RepID=UPI0015FA1B2F|nr:8-amino-7-oxononanoate synthase [Psychromonas sp. SR45-3]MBB1274240.1 8-amino-7-oxononanoate synthase [Psychromonas sp. SR45-3]
MAFSFIAEQLAQRKQQHLHRASVPITGKQARYIEVNGKQYLNFSSNDYLGLASDPLLVNAWKKGADLFGIGSGGSYLVTGYNKVHHDVTQQLQEWLGLEAVALFSSGYSANQALIKLLLSKNDLLVQDKINHASLMEAGSISAAKMQRFKHNDMQHLASILNTHQQTENKLVISEGVFSMDGDSAPINALKQQCSAHKAWLMIDDAHGLGVLGKEGKGTVVDQQLDNSDVNIYMATFGKALGVGGAFVSGSSQLIDYINNFSKPYIYTTGLPPAMVYCIGQAAHLAQTQQWRRDQLCELIRYFKHLSAHYEIPLMPSNTAIQPVLIGSSDTALAVSQYLKDKGFWTTAIRPPTVAKGSARLRITLTSQHLKQDIEILVKQIKQAIDANNF